jgi:hypothetical protein
MNWKAGFIALGVLVYITFVGWLLGDDGVGAFIGWLLVAIGVVLAFAYIVPVHAS